MTSEADGVTVWDRFEGALLQPKRLTQILRRFRYIFFARVALRLIGRVTYLAALRWPLIFLFLK